MDFNGAERLPNMVLLGHRKGRKKLNLIWNLLLCQVRISARAASLNFPELLMMQNKWPENHDSDCCNPLWTPIWLCFFFWVWRKTLAQVSEKLHEGLCVELLLRYQYKPKLPFVLCTEGFHKCWCPCLLMRATFPSTRCWCCNWDWIQG